MDAYRYYQEIQKPKIKTLSRSEKVKKQLESNISTKTANQRVREKNLNGQCFKERKKEKRRYVPVKEEICGESTAKTVFQIRTPERKKKSHEWHILENRGCGVPAYVRKQRGCGV